MMRGRAVILGLLVALAPIPTLTPLAVQAQTEGESPATGAEALADQMLRPRARPMPEPPLRPRARPGTEAAPVDIAPVDTAPAVPTAPEADTAATLPAAETAPPAETLAVTLDTPVIADAEPAGPPREGPPQMVLAETLMSEPPPPPVFMDAWVGTEPVLRPGGPGDAAPDGQAAFLRPEARPEALPQVERPSQAVLRPRPRPAAPQDPAPLVAAAPDAAPVFGLEASDAPQFSALAVAVALRPIARNPRAAEQASNREPPPAPRGSLCGLRGLEGEVLAAIRGSGGCGVEEPVRLISVGGVRLSTPVIMNCETAASLLSWVQASAQPRFNNQLARLDIMGSYDCRPRNNQAGARLSEHGKGRAIDIGGFTLASGEQITVLRDWGGRSWGETLRALHREACGIFGTVLGPNANRQHANHFHFDTAEYRSGAYCR
jgi:hypothetical protein